MLRDTTSEEASPLVASCSKGVPVLVHLGLSWPFSDSVPFATLCAPDGGNSASESAGLLVQASSTESSGGQKARVVVRGGGVGRVVYRATWPVYNYYNPYYYG